MAKRRVEIDVETWTKKYDTKYEKNLVATLVIEPMRRDNLLVSSLTVGGKSAHKPDRFVETDEQVAERRKGLARDGFALTITHKRVPESDARPAWERPATRPSTSPSRKAKKKLSLQELADAEIQLRKSTTRRAADRPSGLTRAERNELVELWSHAGHMTQQEIAREAELKGKAR